MAAPPKSTDMIDPIRRALTQLGGLAAHPLAFLLVVTYGSLWFLFDREGFGWHGLATMAVWFMTSLHSTGGAPGYASHSGQAR